MFGRRLRAKKTRGRGRGAEPPSYIGDFFIDDRLIVTGLGGLVWMSIGGFIMAKMVSFEI